MTSWICDASTTFFPSLRHRCVLRSMFVLFLGDRCIRLNNRGLFATSRCDISAPRTWTITHRKASMTRVTLRVTDERPTSPLLLTVQATGRFNHTSHICDKSWKHQFVFREKAFFFFLSQFYFSACARSAGPSFNYTDKLRLLFPPVVSGCTLCVSV